MRNVPDKKFIQNKSFKGKQEKDHEKIVRSLNLFELDDYVAKALTSITNIVSTITVKKILVLVERNI